MATNGYKMMNSRSYTSPQQPAYYAGESRHPRTAPLSSRPYQLPKATESEDVGAHGGPAYHSLPSPPQKETYSVDQDSDHCKSFPLSKDEEKSRTSETSRPSPRLPCDRNHPQSIVHHFNQEENRTTGTTSTYYMPHQSEAGPSGSRDAALTASKPKGREDLTDYTMGQAIPRHPSDNVCSHDTVENARYSLDQPPSSDHPNEDRHFAVEGDKFKVFCVFDGHNGSRAAGFASNYLLKLLHQPFWKSIVDRADSTVIREALSGLFLDTEKEFFASIEKNIQQKKRLQEKIPQHLTSYAAYLQYPHEVEQLQEVEPKLTGGCTAVMAVIIDNILYVANVGDSRAVLVREDHKGVLVTEQLSVDHTVENEDELKRLEGLGLSPSNLIKAGRLGTQENTRSIGDYSIKSGYKDVDSLRSAHSPPGTAKPDVMVPRRLDASYKYLILMTDGVYKSIESTFADPEAVDSNKVVVQMMNRELRNVGHFDDLSKNVLGRIVTVNKDVYMVNAERDVRSSLAVACRKRDDMTLIVHKLTSDK